MGKRYALHAVDGVQRLMGGIAIAAISIVSLIASAVAAVAVAVVSVVAAIAGAIAAAAVWIGSTVAGALVGVLNGVGIISTAGAASTLSTLGILNVTSLAAYGSAWAVTSTVAASFGAFMNAIHFSTIMRVHSLAMMVSSNYRSMMTNVNTQINKVSGALGLGTSFLTLVLRDARAVVLQASGLIGRRYDLAQLGWLKDLQGYLGKFNDKVTEYKDNPSMVLNDIEDWIERPAGDLVGNTMEIVYSNVDGVIKMTESMVGTVDDVRVDVNDLVAKLPGNIREQVAPMLKPIWENYDRFIDQVYLPGKSEMDRIVFVLQSVNEGMQRKVTDILEDIRRPGDFLQKVNSMGTWERKEQEAKIQDVVFAGYERAVATTARDVSSDIQELIAVNRALQVALPPPAWEVGELETPQRPAESIPVPRESWFVGDF